MTDQNNIQAPPEPSSFRLISSLGIAGFLSGLVLVGVYLFTKPIIEQNKAEALQRAIFKVLPGTTSFETLVLVGEDLVAPTAENEDAERIYIGLNDSKEMTGFAIPGAEPGFQDIIGVLYGYNAASASIIGFEVLESKETPGLGDKIFKDMDFQMNFKALEVDPEIEAVKKGEKDKENQVECITGATISSKAIVRLLNKSVLKWKSPIDDYMKLNNLALASHE